MQQTEYLIFFSDNLLTQIPCEIFIQVKAICHTARLEMSLYESGTIRVPPWPGNASDLYRENKAAR